MSNDVMVVFLLLGVFQHESGKKSCQPTCQPICMWGLSITRNFLISHWLKEMLHSGNFCQPICQSFCHWE